MEQGFNLRRAFMKRLIQLILLSLLLNSCCYFQKGIVIKEEYYLPESGMLKVGEEIEIYMSTEQNEPEGSEYRGYIIIFLGSDDSATTLDKFDINIIKGTDITDPEMYRLYNDSFDIALPNNNGLHELHCSLVPLNPGIYDFRIEIYRGVNGIFYYDGYRKDLQFEITE